MRRERARDTQYVEAMRRVFETAAALGEVNAAVPIPRYPLRKRLLWKLRGVPADVRAEERRIAQERANLYARKLHALRDTLAGSTDERSENG